MEAGPPEKRSKSSDIDPECIILEDDYTASTASSPELSTLELLPLELLSRLVDYAPQVVFGLRLASRSLRAHVDKYALFRPKIRFCEHVRFDYPNNSNQNSALEISLHVPVSRADLLELRFKLLRFPAEFVKRIGRFRDASIDGVAWYYMRLHPNDLWSLVTHMRKWIGRKIGKVTLHQCEAAIALFEVSGLLEGMQFPSLRVESEHFSKNTFEKFVEIVESHEVDRLYLKVKVVHPPDTVSNLLKLSVLLSAMHIEQMPDYPAASNRSIFGAKNVHWPAIITEMLRRRLDQLRIVNAFPEYLSAQNGNALKSSLPFLGRKIWFEATFEHVSEDFNCELNNHVINAKDGLLSIKHLTREEDFPEF